MPFICCTPPLLPRNQVAHLFPPTRFPIHQKYGSLAGLGGEIQGPREKCSPCCVIQCWVQAGEEGGKEVVEEDSAAVEEAAHQHDAAAEVRLRQHQALIETCLLCLSVPQASSRNYRDTARHQSEQASKGASPPDSPRLRSGTSSFSHISSPASYRFGHSDDEGSDSDSSQWSSDEEVGDRFPLFCQGCSHWPGVPCLCSITSSLQSTLGSGQSSFPVWAQVVNKEQGSPEARSEVDSDEAMQDVVAVSQEGSLGSLSDSDAGFGLSRTTSARSAPGTGYVTPFQPDILAVSKPKFCWALLWLSFRWGTTSDDAALYGCDTHWYVYVWVLQDI